MTPHAELSTGEKPLAKKRKQAIRRAVRFIIPLTGTVASLWLSYRLDTSETVGHLNSLGDRLRFIAPSVLGFALTFFFALWSVLAVSDKEPRWAAAIANFAMADLPERQKIWSLRAYLAPMGFIATGAISLSERTAIFWPSQAKLVSQLASMISLFFLFIAQGQFSRGKQQLVPGFGAEKSAGQENAVAGRQD